MKIGIFKKETYFWTVSIVFSVYKQNFMLNNVKTRTVMNATISVFVICVKAIIYFLYNLHDCTFMYEWPFSGHQAWKG